MSDEYIIQPEDELLMHNLDTLPPSTKKFWHRRYELFQKYDQGVYMSAEMWYSVTPEKVALFIAAIIKQLLPEAHDILDICSGAGGNTIQFAQLFPRVGAIDINSTNVYCTKHNCGIYGVSDKTWALTGDWRQLSADNSWIPEPIKSKQYPFDFIFISPPWGGTNYKKKHNKFDLKSMEPLGLMELCNTVSRFTKNFGIFLPKSSNRRHISEAARKLNSSGKAKVIEIVADGYAKGILALFGDDVVKDIDYEGLYEECGLEVMEWERVE